MSSKIKQKKMSILRRRIKESSKKEEPELLFSEFADLATPEQLFQLALEYVKKFPDMSINYICRSASLNALAWLKKRGNDSRIKEIMKDWLLT